MQAQLVLSRVHKSMSLVSIVAPTSTSSRSKQAGTWVFFCTAGTELRYFWTNLDSTVGDMVGLAVGGVGLFVGLTDGSEVGVCVGMLVGCGVFGLTVGKLVGALLGSTLGAGV